MPLRIVAGGGKIDRIMRDDRKVEDPLQGRGKNPERRLGDLTEREKMNQGAPLSGIGMN
ncbi:hypothetical protein [Candidatus Manganitrophus noduliformans]|uniref:hypothetical protein n=1 Tax=Candidatus Manganitrophus noduliformans TaxID=2606439 RepID=UPI001439F120|nr:hypothetical protein [Candidatus Manganitrophus noduliformans]